MTDDDNNKPLGDWIRETRIAKDLTLRELARRLDRAPSYISDIEYSRRIPSEEVLREICKVLDLEFDRMLAAAGRLGAEAERFLKSKPTAGVLFRRVSEARLNEAELKSLLSTVDQLTRKRRKAR
jgi:transcriptional regulator with XRE-family HTH domain